MRKLGVYYFIYRQVYIGIYVFSKSFVFLKFLLQDGRSALVETARSKENREEKILGEITRQLINAGCDINLKCTDLGEVVLDFL